MYDMARFATSGPIKKRTRIFVTSAAVLSARNVCRLAVLCQWPVSASEHSIYSYSYSQRRLSSVCRICLKVSHVCLTSCADALYLLASMAIIGYWAGSCFIFSYQTSRCFGPTSCKAGWVANFQGCKLGWPASKWAGLHVGY